MRTYSAFQVGDTIMRVRYSAGRKYKILQVFEKDSQMRIQCIDSGMWYLVGRYEAEIGNWIIVD